MWRLLFYSKHLMYKNPGFMYMMYTSKNSLSLLKKQVKSFILTLSLGIATEQAAGFCSVSPMTRMFFKIHLQEGLCYEKLYPQRK